VEERAIDHPGLAKSDAGPLTSIASQHINPRYHDDSGALQAAIDMVCQNSNGPVEAGP
jgi:hypothetical protein